MNKLFTSKIIGILSSKKFFKGVLGLYFIESAWIALSALYPQAFDENFHFGIIKIYSHHWLPFLSKQPPNANAYGAVARDPSYLYHYLMSFPYRIIALFTTDQTIQIILLRLIDVGLFAVGLVLFRRILLRVKVSETATNLLLMLFVLIPIVPQLAAQINYDDLLFPLTALSCLMTFDLIDQIKKKKPSAVLALELLSVCFLTTIVKYAFAPIFLGIVLYLAYVSYKTYKHNFKKLVLQLRQDFYKQTKLIRSVLLVAVIISAGMFIQRDGINIIKYHSIAPDCSKVLTVKQCSSYSAWYYNYTTHMTVVSGKSAPTDNIISYMFEWFYWMWYRLFFDVNGLSSGFRNYPPLLLPGVTAVILAFIALIAVIKTRRHVLRDNPYLVFLLVVSGIYALSLFVHGYATYKYTDVMENMNGRYLLPILLPLAAFAVISLSRIIGKSKTPKAILAVFAILMFMEGGGTMSFILSSDNTWLWNNSAVDKVNNDVRKVVKHVVVSKRTKVN